MNVFCRICGKKCVKKTIVNIPVSGMIYFNHYTKCDCENVELYNCIYCGHMQIENKLSNDYYEYYLLLQYSYIDFTNEYYTNSLVNFYKNRIKELSEYCGENKYSVLDIGCANGTTTCILEEFFQIADGVEPSQKYNLYKGNGKYYKGFFENINFEKKYNAIFCVDLLEHIDNIKKFVGKMYEVLDDNGICMVMVPNGEKIIYENHWYDMVLEHCNYFCINSLVKIFSDSGFVILKCSTIKNDWWLQIVCKKIKKDFNANIYNNRSRIIEYNEFFSKFDNIAIWGAGVKGNNFVNSVGISDKVKYIFDCNKVKSGWFMPNSYIPIDYPCIEKIRDMDVIVITALENKNQIIRDLKEKYNYCKKIVCIDDFERDKFV